MLYSLLKIVALFIFKIFFRIEVKGKNKIPKDKAFILASNHLSNLDPIVLGAVIPCKLNYLAKEELFRNKLFALLLRNINVVPLKRGGTDTKAIRIALRILKKGNSLLIFPQGQRGSTAKVKSGVGFLFKKTSLPVIVAKIYGTDKALPKGELFLRFRKIKVIFDRMEDIRIIDTSVDTSVKVLAKIKSLVYH